jgi:hypothetical protein
MKQYTFVLNFGYVESASMTYLPFTSQVKFKGAKEALLDLAKFLKEQYLLRHETKPKKCCLASKDKDSAAEFCSKCGRSLKEEEFDNEHFEDWLQQLDCTNVDSFAGNFIEWDDTQRWQSNGLEGAPNQRFVYNAEWVLLAALGYPHRDTQTWEKICQDRTKAKRESFSYYA